MLLNRPVFFAVCLTILPFFSARAQLDRAPAVETRTLELVDQLKDVIQKAEKSRTDPTLMEQLRELVRRYDWPWRVALLSDDLHNGDYTANPSWTVDKGDFRVSQFGLGTVFIQPAKPTRGSSAARGEKSALEVLGGILGGMTQREEAAAPAPLPSAAEIFTELRISNPFAVKLQMTSRGKSEDGNRLEFCVPIRVTSAPGVIG